MKKTKTLLIDGNNLIHRTFHVAKLQSKSEPDLLSNLHIYFTLNSIFSYVTKYVPDRTIIVWDEKPDFAVNERKVEFADYKGSRSSDRSPHENNNVIKQLAEHLGISSIYPRDLEADDIIAFYCADYPGKKIIVSVDKDFLQLVNNNVVLYDPIRKRETTVESFVEDTGWSRDHWLYAKCILGDKSDNVPGISRFGPKTIKRLIDGEINLTREQTEIYRRNLSLFSLNRFIYNLDEQQYYKEQIDNSIKTNWAAFIKECRQRDFNKILKNNQSWYTTFILNKKMADIFA